MSARLVQLLLPLYGKDGEALAQDLFAETRAELTEKCGGVTAYMRAPAKGLWKAPDGKVERDDVVIFEVMVDSIDKPWWGEYRQRLQKRFRQDELVIRAIPMERL